MYPVPYEPQTLSEASPQAAPSTIEQLWQKPAVRWGFFAVLLVGLAVAVKKINLSSRPMDE